MASRQRELSEAFNLQIVFGQPVLSGMENAEQKNGVFRHGEQDSEDVWPTTVKFATDDRVQFIRLISLGMLIRSPGQSLDGSTHIP